MKQILFRADGLLQLKPVSGSAAAVAAIDQPLQATAAAAVDPDAAQPVVDLDAAQSSQPDVQAAASGDGSAVEQATAAVVDESKRHPQPPTLLGIPQPQAYLYLRIAGLVLTALLVVVSIIRIAKQK